MYEALHGRLTRKEPAFVVVTAGGIGYRVLVPLSTYEALPRAGQDVDLLLHLVVREDEWRLFGFATDEEREAFRTLLRVAGVGPVLALAILGGLGPGELARVVREGDIKALVRVKGVGRKTAERIAVELKDAWGQRGAVAGSGGAPPVEGPLAQAVRALEALGHAPDEARRRVDAAAGKAKGAAPEDVAALVRAALRL
ncbi:MAG: Holliday junction branch migration protein RuvA [Planctomycetota bacterium]